LFRPYPTNQLQSPLDGTLAQPQSISDLVDKEAVHPHDRNLPQLFVIQLAEQQLACLGEFYVNIGRRDATGDSTDAPGLRVSGAIHEDRFATHRAAASLLPRLVAKMGMYFSTGQCDQQTPQVVATAQIRELISADPCDEAVESRQRDIFLVTRAPQARWQTLGRDPHQPLVVILPQLCDGLVVTLPDTVQQTGELSGGAVGWWFHTQHDDGFDRRREREPPNVFEKGG
jgi:hypothetical protein